MLTQENHFLKVSPLQSLIFIVLIAFTGFAFLGPFVGFAFAFPFFEGSVLEMAEAISDPVNNPSVKIPLYITQAFSTIIGFLVLPFLYAKAVLGISNKETIGGNIPTPVISMLVIILVIIFMGVNSIFIEWNSTLNLPESLSGFESWARNFEDRAQELTQFMTSFNSGYEFIVALIVIALLPALGEEFVFRGLVQGHLQIMTRNIHVAVWLSAILFSFFHLQFFGFVPRAILGALFGYLYAWSGNLAYPVIAHFVNNGFTLLMMYLYNKGALDFDIESTDSVPVSTVLISAGITVVLLFIFKSYFRREQFLHG